MDARRIVGWNLRRLRVDKGLTIEGLADLAEVDPSFLGRMERGTVNSSLDVTARLARALKASLSDMVVEPLKGERPGPHLKGSP